MDKGINLDERELAKEEHTKRDLLLDILLLFLFSYFGIDSEYGVYAFGAAAKFVVIIMAALSLVLISYIYIKYNTAYKSHEIKDWLEVNNLINKIYRTIIAILSMLLLLGAIGLYIYITFGLAPNSYMRTYAAVFFITDIILVSSHITTFTFKMGVSKVISGFKVPITRVVNLQVLRMAAVIYKYTIRTIRSGVGLLIGIYIGGILLHYQIVFMIEESIVFIYVSIFVIILILGNIFYEESELSLLKKMNIKILQ